MRDLTLFSIAFALGWIAAGVSLIVRDMYETQRRKRGYGVFAVYKREPEHVIFSEEQIRKFEALRDNAASLEGIDE